MQGLIALRGHLVALRAKAKAGLSPSAVTRWLIETLRLREVLIRDNTQGPGGRGRWENVSSLITLMERYESRQPDADVREFLKHVALERNQEGISDTPDAVTLMTLHAAKGLEWPVCFLVGCQEGLLPHQRTIDDSGDLSEERRLFYVGLTRAREVAILTTARKRLHRGAAKSVKPSRFLADIPKAHRVDDSRTTQTRPEDRQGTKSRFAALKAMLDS